MCESRNSVQGDLLRSGSSVQGDRLRSGSNLQDDLPRSRSRVPDSRRNGGRCRIRQLSSLCLAIGLLAVIGTTSAHAALVSAANGNLAGFSGGLEQTNGMLTAVSGGYGQDTESFSAAYSGTGGGAASGSFQVRWKQGQTVTYGAAFDLPAGFHAATAGLQTLLRWDSRPASNGAVEQEGLVIDYSNDMASVVDTTVSGVLTTQRVIAGPFPLPIGSWFTLQVRQLLGSGAAAYTDVYENGQLVAASRAPTFAGTRINRVRYGIVQLDAGAGQGSVSLNFDQATAANYTGYVNPLGGDYYFTGRTDMGVDFCLNPGEPIRAVGDAVVVGISPNWFRNQPYLWYQLVDGPSAGRYVYVAEQVKRLAKIGTELTAGQPIAYYKKRGTCIEMGWSAFNGATLAQATTGYYEGQITKAGVSFARFLISLGVQGPFELHPTHHHKRKH
jgi:murein DD-endopeptidase MepM/ murein hydrolase activator NlpD